MGADTKLVVVVRMYDGGAMPKATVTLVSTESGGPIPLKYDPDARVYRTKGQLPGRYMLKVDAPGLLTEERPVLLATGLNQEAFYLGPPELPFLYRGRVRVPFEERPDLVGVALTKHPTDKEERELEKFADGHGLVPFKVPRPVRDDRGRVFKKKPGDATSLTEFGEHPLVRRTGPVIRLEKDSLSFLTNELVVKFAPQITDPESDSILERFRLSKIRVLPYAGNTYLVYRQGPADLDLLEVAHQLLRLNENPVVYAEPDLVTTAIDAQVTPQDYLYELQWAIRHARFDHAWDKLRTIDASKTYGDPDILIAIMDRGIESVDQQLYSDPEHPDFAGNVSDGRKKIDRFYNFADMVGGNTTSMNSHGIKVAGVATGLADNPAPVAGEYEGIAGAAPNCRVISLVRKNGGADSEYADAYVWTAGLDPGNPQLPPPITPGADVVNNSFERGFGPIPSILEDALDFVTSFGRGGKGCVMVFAAGNGVLGPVNLDGDPRADMAKYRRTIGVTASTTDGTPAFHDMRTNYSNYGSGLDVCAPSGEKLTGPTWRIVTSAPVNGGNLEGHSTVARNYDGTFTGTSAAAALVSGLAALILSMNPDLTWVQVRGILRNTAVHRLPGGALLPDPDALWSANPPYYNPHYGYGRINAGEAVKKAWNSIGKDYNSVEDTWIKEHPTDGGDVPSYPTYSHDVWVRNLSPALEPTPINVHQSPIRGQDNWVYANIRNRGALASGEVYARLLITRWAGTQYVYPDDFIPVVAPSANPPSPMDMAPGSYLIGESHLESISAGGTTVVEALWSQNLIPPESVTINGTQYSWADSCLLVDVTPHDGPPATGNRTSDNNNICQRNLTIIDVTNQDELELLFVVGHKTNKLRALELLVSRKPLSADVKLHLDYVDPATTGQVHRAVVGARPFLHRLDPVYRGRRMVFALPTRTRVTAPILRDPGEYQPVALVATNLGSLVRGTHRIEVAQRIPGGTIQGLLRFHLVKS